MRQVFLSGQSGNERRPCQSEEERTNRLIIANLPDQRDDAAAHYKPGSDPEMIRLGSNSRQRRNSTNSQKQKRTECTTTKLD